MATAEVLLEDEVTTSNLHQLFKRAFFKTSLDGDGDVVVQTDGPRVVVIVNQQNKLIKFMCLGGFKESVGLETKHAFINKLNDEIILGRFAVPENRPELWIADYYLPYEEGVPAFQIVSVLRLVSRIVPSALRTSDGNDIVA